MSDTTINRDSDIPTPIRAHVAGAYLKHYTNECDPAIHVVVLEFHADNTYNASTGPCAPYVLQLEEVADGKTLRNGHPAALFVRNQMRETVDRLRLPLPDGMVRVVVATPPKMYVLHLAPPTVYDAPN